MPRDNNGNYNLPAGNPVQSGEVIESAWANTTMGDLGTAITDSLDRNGRGGMLAPFAFADGTRIAPGATWNNEPTTGLYRAATGDLRMSVLTNDKMRWIHPGSVQLWDETNGVWDDILTSGGGGAGQTTVLVNQTAHGFALLDCIRWNGTEYVKAQADDAATLALGVVVAINSPDEFLFATSGRFEFSHALAPLEWYYLSDATAGDLTGTEPVTISQPIVYAETNTSIIVYPYRPSLNDPLALELPVGSADGQMLRWDATDVDWAVTNNAIVLEDGTVSLGNLGGLLVEPSAPANTLVVDAAGNVGIGTDAPPSPFTVSEGGNQGWEVFPNSSGAVLAQSFDRNALEYIPTALGGLTMQFNTGTLGGGNTERMRIDAAGLVGIGTDTPGSSLEVALPARQNAISVINVADTSYSSINLRDADYGTNFQALEFQRYGDAAAGNSTIAPIPLANLSQIYAINGANLLIGNNGATPIIFGNAGVERMRITGEGFVGIGTTDPVVPLQVSRPEGEGFEVVPLAGQVAFQTYDRVADDYIDQVYSCLSVTFNVGPTAARVTAGAFGPTGDFQVTNLGGAGNRAVYSTAGGILTNAASDARLKEEVTPIAYGLAEVLQMAPVSYAWIDKDMGAEREVGLIAQEVQALIPEVVGSNFDKTLSLDYSKLTAVLIKAVQELTARVEALEA